MDREHADPPSRERCCGGDCERRQSDVRERHREHEEERSRRYESDQEPSCASVAGIGRRERRDQHGEGCCGEHAHRDVRARAPGRLGRGPHMPVHDAVGNKEHQHYESERRRRPPVQERMRPDAPHRRTLDKARSADEIDKAVALATAVGTRHDPNTRDFPTRTGDCDPGVRFPFVRARHDASARPARRRPATPPVRAERAGPSIVPRRPR
jgi:hypothetical protein